MKQSNLARIKFIFLGIIIFIFLTVIAILITNYLIRYSNVTFLQNDNYILLSITAILFITSFILYKTSNRFKITHNYSKIIVFLAITTAILLISLCITLLYDYILKKSEISINYNLFMLIFSIICLFVSFFQNDLLSATTKNKKKRRDNRGMKWFI